MIKLHSDQDLKKDPTLLPNYVPFEKVDQSEYDILHPETAGPRMGCVSRIVYTRIDKGEVLFTLDNKKKRVLLKKPPILQPVHSEVNQIKFDQFSMESENAPTRSDKTSELVDRVLSLSEIVIEKDRIIQNKDETIQILNNQLQNAHTAIARRNLPAHIPFDPRDKKIEELMEKLSSMENLLNQKKPFWKFWG